MITAEKFLREVTESISAKTGIDVTFQHGNTLTVVNYITKLINTNKVYPAIIMFTEGLTEVKHRYYYEFFIPKIAICTTTVKEATERQRLEKNFEMVIFPIFEAFEKELRAKNAGYNLVINRTDIPYFSSQNQNQFYQLVDGCLIKNLRIKIPLESC